MTDKPKKILLVEDEPDVFKVVALRLMEAGYGVVLARNGQEGLDRVFEECPDLIVTDVLMPVMDGFTFYKNLKKNSKTASIPVLVLTARAHMEDSCRVMGADDFLAKPFEHEILIAKIEALFAQSMVMQEMNKKVLLAGSDKQILEKMAAQLERAGCLTEMAKNGSEIIAKVVQFSPDVLIMEIPLYGMAADEVVKILRQMDQFDQRPILIYNFFRAEDLGEITVRQRTALIEDTKQACIEAGTTYDIGWFNEFTFLELIQDFLMEKSSEKEESPRDKV